MSTQRKAPVVLDEKQAAELEKISKSKKEELRRVQRARILLMAANGASNGSISNAVGLSDKSIRNTISKFLEMGMSAALNDLPRSGRPAVIDDEAKAWVKSLACEKPKELGYAQELWTLRLLSKHVRSNCVAAGHECLFKVSPSKIWTILDEDKLKPHRVRYYLERRDPDFQQKMEEVIKAYKEAELEREGITSSGVVTVSFDEKPGIQAKGTVAPDRPPTLEHGFVWRDYEYKRFGTVTLLGGLNILTGEVVGLVRDTHASADFIEFLKRLDEVYADATRIRVILDNHSAHTSKETRKFLETRPGRFEFIFTPKHGSWLNLVESFFGKLSRVFLRGIRVASKEELVKRLYQFLDEGNENPTIYRWKYKMDEVEL
jgi:transposase